ncbi:DUF4304 domain-containing protein [Flavobacterium ginsenosidimutans]|uniref:DUF4304 domain-containing protein n=1 Tax=Flavobacterium ginsenosidimutans TaxID=687844 RepID=A0ABZ2Q6Q9_9FLAO
MNAKEKQLEFIKTYLKPTLKAFGYKSSGQRWWKDKGEFYTIINLQNFSWNTKEKVNFCFNIGVVLKAIIGKDKKPTYADLTGMLREDAYLTEQRKKHSFRNHSGYLLKTGDDLNHFIEEFNIDFENYILSELEKLNSIQDCLDFYSKYEFWFDVLKKTIEMYKIS